jgi:hypothetical protein
VVCEHTAGDPMQEEVYWTYLTAPQIADELAELGTPVSADTVRGLLADFGFHKRQAEKTSTMAEVPHRDEQFEKIARLKERYSASPHNPIISMDTKKKEFLGELFREGRVYANGPNAVFDHDFPALRWARSFPTGCMM